LKLVLRPLLALSLLAMMISTAHAQPPTPLWSDDVETTDIAVSKDGQYVAVATPSEGRPSEVRFYSRSSATPLWTWSADSFYSVAISEHGEYVAAGGYVWEALDYYVFYWKNARALTGTPDPDWTSNDVGGGIDERCLDMSDDGNYVVACGTGVNVFYWADARHKSGVNVATTWNWLSGSWVEAVDLSSDGDYVVVGTTGPDVAYWKNARSLSGTADPDWQSMELDTAVADVAVSDDGNYVAAATGGAPGTVYYWAGARSLSGDPSATWYSGEETRHTSIDMSCDGDSVVAGASGGVFFWGGARGLTGKPQDPSWDYFTESIISDVAINDAGTYVAAVDDVFIDTLFFFDRQGNLLWEDLEIRGDMLSMSCDGRTLAVGHFAPETVWLLDTGYSSPCCGVTPVGGVVSTPTAALIAVAPFVAFAGLAVAVAVAVVVVFAKKRAA